MTLSTMQPDPAWDATAEAATVDSLAAVADEVVVHVWGGDWCGDCRRELPALAAALRAADIPEERIHQHPVDQDKRGELVEAYEVSHIPTVVLEIDGETVARFEEQADRPAARYLADELANPAAE
ncbi:MAG: TlpA family protein disulfide reductase [Halobacteriaceae archaeon]